MTLDEIKEKINLIKEKTDLVEFKESIDDLVSLLDDDISLELDDPELLVKVDYTRKLKSVAVINTTSYDDLGENILITPRILNKYTTTLNTFLDCCEIADSMSLTYNIRIEDPIGNGPLIKVSNFIYALKALKSRCESYNINVYVGKIINRILRNIPIKEIIDKLENEVDSDRDIFYIQYIRELEFVKKLDNVISFSEEDPSNDLPKNIISDFNTFAKKFKMANRDKKELINIFNRGDWKKMN